MGIDNIKMHFRAESEQVLSTCMVLNPEGCSVEGHSKAWRHIHGVQGSSAHIWKLNK